MVWFLVVARTVRASTNRDSTLQLTTSPIWIGLSRTPNLANADATTKFCERCQHLVFERADGCFEKFHEQIQEIMKYYLKFSNRKQSQIIVSSDEWSEAVKQFVQVYLLRSEYVGPYFVLGNPLKI